MREDAFRMWMKKSDTMTERPIGDAISRCKRVENSMRIDLDDAFNKDRGYSVMQVLEYTADDMHRNVPAPDGFIFSKGANIKNGMASLRAAAKKYFEFCSSEH